MPAGVPPQAVVAVAAVGLLVAVALLRRLAAVAVVAAGAVLAMAAWGVPGLGSAPTPAPPTTPAAGALADTAIASLVRSSGLAGCRGVPAGTWVAVALAESGGRPGARNASGEDSRGLWQINMRAHAGWVGNRNLYDPAVNAWAARTVCERQGIGAWGAYTNGSYRAYLARGHAAAN